jgi:hypothetical protein
MKARLAQRLRDATRSGVYRAASADAVLEAAKGLDVARIDLAGAQDKAVLLARIARALEFPDWFGGNWDALEDCLGDLSWRRGGGHVLVFSGADALGRDDWGALADVLASSAEYRAGRDRPFFAVFVGGPETLPEIDRE